MSLVGFLMLTLATVVGVWVVYSVLPTYVMKLIQLARRTGRGSNTKHIALTFDDGPSACYTPRLLDLLARYNIKATFFVVGVFAQDNPDIIARMIAEGHEVGTHSYAHSNGLFMTPRATIKDLARTAQVLRAQGVPVVWCRPPWGHVNLACFIALKKEGLRLFLWDVMAQDWSARSTVENIEQKLLHRVSAGSTICLHDGRGSNHAPARTIEALESVLPQWIERGYVFETASTFTK